MIVVSIAFVFSLCSLLTSFIYFNMGNLEEFFTKEAWFFGTVLFVGFFVGSAIVTRIYARIRALRPLHMVGWFFGGILFYLMCFALPMLALGWILKACGFFDAARTLVYLSFISAILCTAIGYWQRVQMKILRHAIATENDSLKGKKIAVFADPQFTVSNDVRHAEKITRFLKDMKPDAILIAGDFFNGEVLHFPPLEAEMKKWTTIAPIYAVTGNHEHYGPYGEFLEVIQRAGITVLDNESLVWEGVRISGFRYAFTKEQKEENKKAIQKEGGAGAIDIVLIHEPSMHHELADTGATVVFSGHTHNGQFWPFNYFVRAKYGKYTYGHHTVKDTRFITTSGTGLAGLPSRFLNTPEILEIDFH